MKPTDENRVQKTTAFCSAKPKTYARDPLWHNSCTRVVQVSTSSSLLAPENQNRRSPFNAGAHSGATFLINEANEKIAPSEPSSVVFQLGSAVCIPGQVALLIYERNKSVQTKRKWLSQNNKMQPFFAKSSRRRIVKWLLNLIAGRLACLESFFHSESWSKKRNATWGSRWRVASNWLKVATFSKKFETFSLPGRLPLRESCQSLYGKVSQLPLGITTYFCTRNPCPQNLVEKQQLSVL